MQHKPRHGFEVGLGLGEMGGELSTFRGVVITVRGGVGGGLTSAVSTSFITADTP